MKKVLLSLLIIAAVAGIASAGIVRSMLMVSKISKCTVLTNDIVQTSFPFTIEHGRLVVEIEVKTKNGKAQKQKFIFDTGAATILSTDVANERGFKKAVVSVTSIAYGNEQTTQKNYITDEPIIFKMGDMQIEQDHIQLDKLDMMDMKCIGASGLIGSNMLSKFIVSLDFEQKIVTLYNKDRFDYATLGAYSKKIPFMSLMTQHNPYITMNVAGVDFNGLLDTGFPDVSLECDDKDSTTLMNAVKGKDVTEYETYGGRSNINGVMKEKLMMYSWNDASLKSDDATFQHSIIFYNNHKKKSLTSMPLTLGLSFLSQYNKVILDWKKKDIYFYNARYEAADTVKKPDIAAQYLPDEGKYRVGVVRIGSAFYNKGVRSGDEVLMINDCLLSSLNRNDACKYLDSLSYLNKNARRILLNKGGATAVIEE